MQCLVIVVVEVISNYSKLQKLEKCNQLFDLVFINQMINNLIIWFIV